MLQGLGSILGVITVLIAALIGRDTFKRWKEQKLAERHIEQAERILTATYNARRSLSRLRSPMMLPHEFDAAQTHLKETGVWDTAIGKAEQDRLTTAQAYYSRLNSTQKDRQALEECQPMARALFGEKLELAIEKLNHQFWTVKVYVDANHRDKTGADTVFRRKIESTIWEGYPSTEENELDQIITAQVKIIEDICVPVLRLENNKPKTS